MDIDIPHDLGQAEAKRRIEQGLPKLEQHIPGGGTLSATWPSDDVLEMEISAMAQTIPVRLVVEADRVRGTVSIPMFLKMMSGPISDFIKTSATKMLSKPA
ncbi:polyhydroxyalkanoic acid system family protein [Sphingobium sp. AP49]|uniref:polyhydroxyalkanoic acid system family protein n=1 Tax=Sphingobium sp. AP49 TaxID=1144307 RepID=UPI00026ECD8D|nr:polyhydroxyalkanoic acid system family protein [Sphingobium sp. AP49]WHO38155.1 polyhydroxyalkanoic acid system family protein [Sphingobium sp. AP49]